MSTFTIRVTQSATNAAGTAYGQQSDLGAPSFFDLYVTNSSDPAIPNGRYDAYCLNPLVDILISPTTHTAENYAGNTAASFVPVGLNSVSQVQVDQINWLLSQNFTSDAKFGGQYNFGEVQTAIWKLVGFTDAQIAGAGLDLFINDNNRNVISTPEINFLVSSAQSAVASGLGVLPTDAFFSTIIDPAGNTQPLVVQLQSAKLGNFVWNDTNGDGLQSGGEAGVDNVVVELYSSTGVKLASTLTGDDFSTVAVEHGYYQFAGLQAGAYQVKFVAPTYAFTAHDANGNSQDTIDSDADVLTGFSQIVNLAVGESNQTIDAGLVAVPPAPAKLSGFVYEDFGNDGVRGAGEPVIGGVTVTLTGVDNLGNAVSASTVTNALGFYEFTGLAAGTYSVTETQPGAYLDGKDTAGSNGGSVAVNDVISGVVLTSGANSINNNFGELVGAQIRGFVYCDDNNDGIKQGTELGLGGVTINLTGTDDLGAPVTASTVTAADGSYAFIGLRPGSYTVTEPVQPAGKLDGIDTAGFYGNGTAGNEVISNIVLTQGLISGDNNFGEILPAKISGYVYLDAGDDGVRNAEPAIAGVTITLSGTDDRGNAVSASTTTNAQGFYQFTGLRPGTYTTTETQPAGYQDGKDTVGSTGGSAATNDVISGIVLVAGGNSTENNFGELPLAKAHIGDLVFEDKNANGVQDAGELGIAGVTVTLCDASGNPIATTTTNAAGGYGFDVAPGTYSVAVTAPAGYFVAPKDAGGNDATDSDINGAGKTGNYALAPGEVNNTVDAGLYRQASLGDRVWIDANGNGQQDAGEAGKQGVTVNLCDVNGNVVATQATDVNGNYLFTGLTPGSYSVQFVAPVGFLLTTANSGADATDSDANSSTGKTGVYLLASGDDNRTVDAGLVQTAVIGDRVFEDKNANGVQDAGETGKQGVTVELYTCVHAANGNQVPGALVATRTTDVNGNYTFAGLLPGDYVVKFIATDGSVLSTANVGNDAFDSDAGANGFTGCYTLASGETNTSVDAGYYKTASLGNKVFVDIDKDGVQDANEPGVAGVKVYLLDAAGAAVGSPLTTNAAGEYLFTNLTPGAYSVRFDLATLPAGYTVTTRDAAAATDATDSDADVLTGRTIVTTLDSGETDLTWDMGIQANVGIDIEKYVHGEYLVQGATGGEGLTPGFWKNHTGLTSAPLAGWPETGLTPTTSYETIFGVDVPAATPTLLDALSANGGGVYALLRHSTAALLNASDSYVSYLYSKAQVILMVQQAFASGDYETPKNLLATQNELGADLSTPASSGSTLVVTPDVDADTVGSGPVIPVGGTAVFTYVVKNTGTTELGNIAVTDDRIAALTFVGGDTDHDGRLDVGETWTYTARETVAAGVQYVNIGTVSGRDAVSGVTVTDNDAAHYSTTALGQSLGDRVWLDSNANGIQDAGEQGIAGVSVQLKNSSGAVLQTTSTDANGNYLFDVAAGSYLVTVLAPSGYLVSAKDQGGNDSTDSDIDATTKTTGTVTVAAGQQNLTVDAGLYQTASIGDKVWLDSNSNGMLDAGELGAAGVSVKLLGANGAVLASQTTDANGNYLFSALTPGSYAVQFGTLTGYSFTTRDAGGNDATDSDADTTTGKTIYTTLESGEVDRTWDAGLTPLCREVTFDFSGNSSTDGGDGNSRSYTDALSGVSVTARAFSQDKGSNNWQAAYLGAYGGGLGVTDSSEGDGSGNAHTIDNVGRNNYVVLQFSQSVELDKAFLGYVVGDSDLQVWIGNSASTITTMNNTVLASMGFSEVNTTTLTTARWADLNAGGVKGNVIIIAADTTDTTPEDYFKLQQLAVCAPDNGVPAAKASIGNFVWEDKNFNGLQDAGEAGVANVTVKLLSSAGAVVSTTTTDASGQYGFSNLNPADYKIQVVAPSGYYATKKDQGGNNAVDSDIDSTGTTVLTTLTAGENDLSWDAGLYRKASVGDKVWSDSNHNNLQDVGEVGIANIVVKLLDTSGAVLATTTTNSSGNYLFSNLDPGSYALLFDKSGVKHYEWGQWNDLKKWAFAVKDAGSNDAVDSDVAGDAYVTTHVSKTDVFTLMSGQNDMTRDAGITPIVIDLDGNGIHTLSRAADSSAGFDLFGNGSAVKSGWISGSDGFLAVDKNGNGKIDSIHELFGGNAKGAGFANLASFDSNGDGLVNSLDAHFGQLMVWRDANSNHATDAGELISLAQAGVTSLTVAYTELPFIDAQDNLHLERSTATLAGGAEVAMTDVYFNVAAADATAAGIKLPTMADLLGDDRALDTVLGGAGMASTCQVRLADEASQANGGDAGEVLRRLAALTRDDHHAAVV